MTQSSVYWIVGYIEQGCEELQLMFWKSYQLVSILVWVVFVFRGIYFIYAALIITFFFLSSK